MITETAEDMAHRTAWQDWKATVRERSAEEATRLGFTPAPALDDSAYGWAVIAVAFGPTGLQALAGQGGFSRFATDWEIAHIPNSKARPYTRTPTSRGMLDDFPWSVVWPRPDSSWDLLAARRDGDAVIALFGTDQGDKHNDPAWPTTYLCVGWQPVGARIGFPELAETGI